jgi:hypothetical protein
MLRGSRKLQIFAVRNVKLAKFLSTVAIPPALEWWEQFMWTDQSRESIFMEGMVRGVGRKQLLLAQLKEWGGCNSFRSVDFKEWGNS